MRSKRNVVILGAVIVAGLLALALLTSPGAEAAKKSLKGAYHFTNSEIRMEGSDLIYCDSFGIIVFDGKGRADIREAWGFGRCVPDPPGGTPVEDGCFDYEVATDGSLLITERDYDDASGDCTEKPEAERYVTHCQILDGGKLLLCDGSGGGPGAVLPDDRLLWTATAGKL